MNINELEKTLSGAIDDFASEIRAQYPEGHKEPVTSEDINEVARQTFYTLHTFKDEIIRYLKEL